MSAAINNTNQPDAAMANFWFQVDCVNIATNQRENKNPLTINVIHDNWFGQYDVLEERHDYIQWLMPTYRASAFNGNATALDKQEAAIMRTNLLIGINVIKSYMLMLDFFGVKLCNWRTGEVKRAANYASRFEHLNKSTHNHLRITRILCSLGQLGFDRYKQALIKFLIGEITGGQPGELDSTVSGLLVNCTSALKSHWIPACMPTGTNYGKVTLEDGPQDRGEHVIFRLSSRDELFYLCHQSLYDYYSKYNKLQ